MKAKLVVTEEERRFLESLVKIAHIKAENNFDDLDSLWELAMGILHSKENEIDISDFIY